MNTNLAMLTVQLLMPSMVPSPHRDNLPVHTVHAHVYRNKIQILTITKSNLVQDTQNSQQLFHCTKNASVHSSLYKSFVIIIVPKVLLYGY